MKPDSLFSSSGQIALQLPEFTTYIAAITSGGITFQTILVLGEYVANRLHLTTAHHFKARLLGGTATFMAGVCCHKVTSLV